MFFTSLPCPSDSRFVCLFLVLSDRHVAVPAGPVNLSTSAQLVAPAAVVRGTLSITASELYFEVDEDEPSFKAIDPKVRDSSSIDYVSNWHLFDAPTSCSDCDGWLHASFMFKCNIDESSRVRFYKCLI